MESSIKTREIVHEIKTKDNNNHLSHFVKNSIIQTKPQDTNNKEATSVETGATNKIQKALKSTSIQSFERAKTYTKNKIKTKREQTRILNETIVTEKPIYSHHSPKSHFKTQKFSQQMRQLNIAKHKRKIKEAKEAKTVAVTVKDTGTRVIKTTFIAVKKAVTALPSLAWAGIGLILLLIIALFIGVFSAFSSSSVILPGTASLSEEVLAHTETIEKYAKQYDIEDYVTILQAIMMQESGGKGNDPMQASESGFNEKYPRVPNGITDPEYSIEVGVKTFADCIKQAKVKDPFDTEKLYLALQGYNYGNGYISWAITNFGGYSKANAKLFSDMQKQKLGTNAYGDPDYVDHVMRYVGLGFGNIRGEPNFENMKAWGMNNYYSQFGLYGQCTWFAWGRFYEIYGYSPGFTGDGTQCVDQLVAEHPDKFVKSNTPKAGAVFSGIGHNHVGIVIAWDGTNITIQEGNLDGRTNTFQEAKTDWQTKTYTLAQLNSIYKGVVFGNPK